MALGDTHTEVVAEVWEDMQTAWGFEMGNPTFNISSSAPNSMTMGKLANLSPIQFQHMENGDWWRLWLLECLQEITNEDYLVLWLIDSKGYSLV